MKPTSIFSLFTFAAFAATGASATKVIQASKNNFKDLINSQEPVLVEFFAPWCGHCKKLAPEFEKAAAELESQKIKLVSVDCDVEKDICAERKIRGYPTLTVFRDGKEVTQYGGAREASPIAKFMKKIAAPAVSKLTTPEELERFKEADELVVVGYFASGANEIFSKVAEKMRNDYSFAVMTPSSATAPEGTVMVYKKFDEKEAKLAEALSFESLTAFIAAEAIPLVSEIGPENYAKYVESGRPLAYFFYADEKQKEQYQAAVMSAAKAVKGKVNTVFINAGLYGQHAEVLNLDQEWPAFSIHDMDKDLKYPFPKAEKITADALTKHMQSFVKGTLKPHFKSQPLPKKQEGPVTVVVHDNFEKICLDKGKDVLLEIYSPGCGACKMIAPEYEDLAGKLASLSKTILVAKFDGTANDLPPAIASTFKLEHFPTFLLFKAKTNELVTFDGDLSFNALVEFVEKNAESGKVSIERKAETAKPADASIGEEESDHDEL